jgi:hypothetical protein
MRHGVFDTPSFTNFAKGGDFSVAGNFTGRKFKQGTCAWSWVTLVSCVLNRYREETIAAQSRLLKVG